MCAALAPLQPPALDPKLRLGGVRVVWQPAAVTGRTGCSLPILAATQPLAASSSGPRNPRRAVWMRAWEKERE